MSFLVIGTDNHAIGQPVETIPALQPGQRVEPILLGYGSTNRWDAELNGFVDIEPRTFKLLDWLMLFTQAERMAIRTKRRSTPTLDDQLALVEAAAPGIRLDDPLVASAIQALVTAKLLIPVRATAILAGTPPS